MFFGDIGEEPPLPPNIHEILASPCPFDPKKTVMETHMLVLVPARVKGVPLTLNHIDKLMQAPRGGDHNTQLRRYDGNKPVLDQYGEVPCRESHWVLMTRDVLPETRKKSFKNQSIILKGFKTYQVPTLLDATVCILMEYVLSGNRLFSDNPRTYTRCLEKCDDWQTDLGSFGVAGLSVSISNYDLVNSGLAAFWKF